MVGIDFKVPNKYGNYLHQILYDVDLLNYKWGIYTDDFIYYEDGKMIDGIFNGNYLTGEEFRDCISKDEYYMIFADIKAYPIDSNPIKIEKFKDFLESDCEFIILCSDSSFTEFYCKDKDILNKVYNNCVNNCFENIEYITIENAMDRNMFVW